MRPDPAWRRAFVRAVNLARGDFGSKATWFTLLSGSERVVGVVQTILLSRLIGIRDYGAYAVLFATLGLVNTILGLQSGLAATVFVSRHLKSDPAKVAGTIRSLTHFAIGLSIAVVLLLLPFYRQVSVLLYQQPGYEKVTLIGIMLIAASVWSGIQDGFAQGFESFRFLAVLRLSLASISLVLVTGGAYFFGLAGAVLVVLLMLLPKVLLLKLHVDRLRRNLGIPRRGEPLSLRSLIVDFALPTVGVGAIGGFAQWFGILYLSRAATGLKGVAIVNTGLQWRGPALLIAGALGSVAMPRFSRHFGSGQHADSRRLRRKMVLVTAALTAAISLPVALAAPWIMVLYGRGFRDGALAFSLVVLSSVPMVIANVYVQEMIASSSMWRQFVVQSIAAVAIFALFALLIPVLGATGFGIGQLLGALVLLGLIMMSDRMHHARRSPLIGSINEE